MTDQDEIVARCLEAAEAEVARLREALRGLLLSADASWEQSNAGHDWREACVTARSALSLSSEPKAGATIEECHRAQLRIGNEAAAQCAAKRAAEAEAARLREALRFYAAEGTYQCDEAPMGGTYVLVPNTEPIWADRGTKAIEALSTPRSHR